MENPIKFAGEVRQEMKKVTWPQRKEVIVTSVMVVVMVIIAALFFLGVDQVISKVIKLILGWD